MRLALVALRIGTTSSVLRTVANPDIDLYKIRNYMPHRILASHQDEVRMELDERGATATIFECRLPRNI